MRILLPLYGSLDQLSGGYRYDRRLVEHLRARGDEVRVLELPARSYRRELLAGLRGEAAARIASAAEGVDLLLLDELLHPSLWRSGLLRRGRLAGLPRVAVVHHLLSDEPRSPALNALIRRAERSFLRGMDGALCNTQVTRERVHALLGRELPGVVAPPAAELAPTPGRGARAGPGVGAGPRVLRLLLVGNVIQRKGAVPLLRALAELPAGLEGWRLTLVGRLDMEPGYVARVRGLVRRQGWEERVRITGPLEGSALKGEYTAADLFAMPSTYEGFGMAYLEAMGFGLPVIASAAGGAREIVREGVNGFLVEPGDRPALVRRLRELMSDVALRRRLGGEARRTWEAHPDWEAAFAQVGPFLKRMLDGERR